MNKILLVLVAITYLSGEDIGYPKWFFDLDNQSNIPICIKINDSISTARTIAITKAKVELQRMKEVELSSDITLETNSSNNSYNSTSKEIIKQKSEGIVKGGYIIKSGVYIVDNIKNYCLLYGQAKVSDKK